MFYFLNLNILKEKDIHITISFPLHSYLIIISLSSTSEEIPGEVQCGNTMKAGTLLPCGQLRNPDLENPL